MRREATSGQLFVAALVAAALAAILLAIPKVNYGCCLWMIGGGLLAGFLVQRSTQSGLTMGEGVMAGLITGVLAAVISFAISRLFFWDAVVAEYQRGLAQAPEESREMMESMFRVMSGPIGIGLGAVMDALLGLIGGLLAAVIWKPVYPAGDTQPPPPPPSA